MSDQPPKESMRSAAATWPIPGDSGAVADGAKVLPFPTPGPERGWAGEAADTDAVPLTAAQWRAFYDQHWRFVFQVVRRFAGHDVEVEDAVQDVFLVLCRKLGSFEGRSQLRTWMYRVCLNVTSEHRRRAMRKRRLEQAAAAVSFWRDGGERDAHDLVSARSDLDRVHAILSKMSDKKREVFVLREIEQLSGDEVAEILAIPPATVRTRLFHARKEFARLLEKSGARGLPPFDPSAEETRS